MPQWLLRAAPLEQFTPLPQSAIGNRADPRLRVWGVELFRFLYASSVSWSSRRRYSKSPGYTLHTPSIPDCLPREGPSGIRSGMRSGSSRPSGVDLLVAVFNCPRAPLGDSIGFTPRPPTVGQRLPDDQVEEPLLRARSHCPPPFSLRVKYWLGFCFRAPLPTWRPLRECREGRLFPYPGGPLPDGLG